jgi:hypothetical protein
LLVIVNTSNVSSFDPLMPLDLCFVHYYFDIQPLVHTSGY